MNTKFFKGCTSITVLATFFLVYHAGLNGGFIFDDYHSLPKLEIINDDLSKENIFTYIGASDTGPLKRPISVLSFLLDGTTWPTAAYSFKVTNVIIHLLCGLFLFLFILRVFKAHQKYRENAFYIALFSASCWLLHPFLVSTTLYVVQRMAMLPAMFSLLGMWVYISGRLKFSIDGQFKTIIQTFFGVYLFIALAVFSKENGVLMLFFLGLIELFICQYFLQLKPLPRKINVVLLKVPIFLLITVLLIKTPDFINGYEKRDFSVVERVLSQFRALTKYLYHLFVPDYFTEGVFADGFKKSTGLLTPVSTALSFVFIVSVIIFAWLIRKKYVWLSFSLMFFFVAHSMESSIVPLELYFEHRNYLASFFLFVPFALLFIPMIQQSKIFIILPVVVLLFLSFNTALRTDIWSDNFKMHQMTMVKFPESIRARTLTASYYEKKGLNEEAVQTLDDGLLLFDDLELRFNRASLLCKMGKLTETDVINLNQSLSIVPYTKNDVRPMGLLMAKLLIKDCLPNKSLQLAEDILSAFKSNPRVKAGYGEGLVLYLEGSIALEKEEYDRAKTNIFRSFELNSGDFISMNNAIVKFISKKQFKTAEELLVFTEQHYIEYFKYKVDWLKFSDNINQLRVVIDTIKSQEYEVIDNNPSKE